MKLSALSADKSNMTERTGLHGIVSDIHANIFALRAVVEHGRARGVKRWLNAGDTVGYGCHPAECIRTLRELDVTSVRGNHDYELLSSRHDIRYWPALEAIRRTAEMLETSDFDFLRKLSRLHKEEDLAVTHELTFPISILCQRISFVGHTHIPSFLGLTSDDWRQEDVRLEHGRRFPLEGYCRYSINPGSVGYPRDGDPRASFMVYDPEANWIELVRLDYPHNDFLAAMRKAGFPERIIDDYGETKW